MGTTFQHEQPEHDVVAPRARAAAPQRPGLLAVLAEAVGAARAVSGADASARVAIANRFAERVS